MVASSFQILFLYFFFSLKIFVNRNWLAPPFNDTDVKQFSIVYIFFLFMQDWADAKLPERGLFSCLSVIPKVLLAGAITLMDEAYFKLAVWLNDKGLC